MSPVDAENHSVKVRAIALAAALGVFTGIGIAAGVHGALLAGCVVAGIAATYGAWRFGHAYRLTGSRVALAAAVVSLAWPAVALVTIAGNPGGPIEAGAASSAGAMALAGFGLSRSNHWRRMRVGLWLPQAVDAWKNGDVSSLEQLVEVAAGEAASAHASRTAALAYTLAEPLSLTHAEVNDLVLAVLVHPLGAVLAGAEATCPPSHEAAMRAARMLEQVAAARGAGDVLRHFGERWDGRGPEGLAGEQLVLGGRIFAAIEAFDKASEAGLEAAIHEMRAGSGSAFDPVITTELIHLFRAKPALAA